jgi:hypothetical protein
MTANVTKNYRGMYIVEGLTMEDIDLEENFMTSTPETEPSNFAGIKGDDPRSISKKQRVFVFRNLNVSTVANRLQIEMPKDEILWSIRTISGGKTIHHTLNAWLENCEFKVHESGRQRVLDTGKKNVHAGVIGDLVTWKEFDVDVSGWTPCYYNPVQFDSFVDARTKKPIYYAEQVVMAKQFVGPADKKVPFVMALNAR